MEAEALLPAPACWYGIEWSALSGGRAATCGYGAQQPLSWSVNSASGGVVRLYGYRDEVARGFRVRIDGGAWASGVVQGAVSPSALFFTSPSLSTGTHRFDLEWVSSNGPFSFDYYELESGSTTTTSPPPTTSAPTTSAPTTSAPTTSAPTTSAPTTSAPTTSAPTTSAPTTSSGNNSSVCNIAPADGQDAISRAIANCPNGTTVRFPTGASYTQTGSIVVDGRSNLTIDGNGSTFTKTSPSVYSLTPPRRGNWVLSRNANVTVTNMKVRGVYGPASRTPDNSTNQWDHGFHVLGGNGTTVRDVDVRNVYGEFLNASPYGGDITQPARNVRVERLTGVHAKRQGVAVTGAVGFWLTDSSLSDCAQLCFDAEADITGERLQDIHVLRNTFSGFYVSAIGIAGPVPSQGTTNPGDIDNIEIRGNTMLTPSDTCWPPIWAGRGPISRLVVEDNPSLKSQGNGVELNDVVSATVARNHFEATKPRIGWCNTNDNPVNPANPRSGPTVPVWRYRSTVTVSGNTTSGY